MNTNQTDTNQMQEQEIDLIELFYKLLAHWRWFLLAAVVALTGAYIYVHVTTPVYQATASVVIKDSEGSNKAIDELFQKVAPSSLTSANTQIEDEMEILRSRSILLQVINELNLHTKYKVKDGLFYNETTMPPIIASMDKASMDTLSGTLLIQVEKAGERYMCNGDFHRFPCFCRNSCRTMYFKITARTSVFRSYKDKYLSSYRCRKRLFRSAGGHHYLKENFYHQSDLQGYG